jgi:hypothetical protein
VFALQGCCVAIEQRAHAVAARSCVEGTQHNEAHRCVAAAQHSVTDVTVASNNTTVNRRPLQPRAQLHGVFLFTLAPA